MDDTKIILKGLHCCSFDKDVFPLCEQCPYSFNGEKCEDNETGVRCCNELKNDLLELIISNYVQTRGNVIEGLEWILEDDRFGFGVNWETGEPKDDYEKAGKIITDTIALLKEQKAVPVMQESQQAIKPICKIIFDVPYYFCGDCKTVLNMYSTKAKFCSQCGQVVQWGNMTVKESKENVRDKMEEPMKTSMEYLDWYFTYDDGMADKDAQKAWFELRERIN